MYTGVLQKAVFFLLVFIYWVLAERLDETIVTPMPFEFVASFRHVAPVFLFLHCPTSEAIS